MKRGISLLLIFTLFITGCGAEQKQQQKTEQKNNVVTSEAITPQNQKSTSSFDVMEKDGGVYITACNTSPSALVIPESIEGKTVKGITQYAFEGKDFKEVVIPKTVKVVGDRSFMGCHKLKKIVVKTNDAFIPMTAFFDCEAVTTVVKAKGSHNVLFMGNSLTAYPAVPSHFQSILKKKEKTGYNVMTSIKLGEGIPAHLEDIKRTGLRVALGLADVVVIQDAYIYSECKKNVVKVMKYCDSKTQFYYWLTDWLEKWRRDSITKEFKGYHGLKILNNGDLFDHIIDADIYQPKELYVKEDNHPNVLYGFFTAMYIYHVLCKDKVSDIDNMDFLNKDVSEWLTTKSKKSEMTKVKRIQNIIEVM